ncbi:outer membrane protein with beta-barrel domain [Maribacter vaceletii]|uniref:Outer membrane protein with beta-barrel domain n=1 Tax=Maribacter vaceletii TaxID=1206816 RepID=A0A495EBA2_9FLAO|nr:porin family protein [Maribacter vaceletii]RKR14162.1 outer membrane protein with beta-barrel domain [Maribacter vaceletii]
MLRILFFLVFSSFFVNAQKEIDSTFVDPNFLEDQFYIGVTYNFLVNKDNAINQRNLSYGLQGGFIKDIPLNKSRKLALGVGLGYALNNYYSNLRATETDSGIEYSILTNTGNYKRNKIESHVIEMPLEFRWRNATGTDYKFWRIYAGLKLGYVLSTRSKYIGNIIRSSFYNKDTSNFQYGVSFNFGYNTFNIHMHYSLSNLFNDSTVLNGESINMKPLRVGLIFYIL